MNWFETSNIASFAKSAIKEAQKSLDKALIPAIDDGNGENKSVVEVWSSYFEQPKNKNEDLSLENESNVVSIQPTSNSKSLEIASSVPTLLSENNQKTIYSQDFNSPCNSELLESKDEPHCESNNDEYYDESVRHPPEQLSYLLDDAMVDKRSEAGSSSSKSYEVIKVSSGDVTSGDEMETLQGYSDIEVVSSPTAQLCENSKLYVLKKSGGRHHRTGSEISIPGSDESSQSEIDRLVKKIKDMTEILEARESKILDLSRSHIEIQEKNTDLNSQIKEALKNNTKLNEAILVSEKFAVRISEMEKKLQTALSERDALKKENQEYQRLRESEAVNQSSLVEKDEVISALREEGDKLSKEVGKYSELLKKIRLKEKRIDKENSQLSIELKERKEEIERLTKSLSSKNDVEVSQIKALQTLTSSKDVLEKENESYKEEMETQKNKITEILKENSALKTRNAFLETQKEEYVTSNEIQIQFEKELKEFKEKYDYERNVLLSQVQETQICLLQQERSFALKEKSLRVQRDEFQSRFENSEKGNEKLRFDLEAYSKPLLRQISELEASYNEVLVSCETLELNLNERYQDVQIKLTKALEREQNNMEELKSCLERIMTLELEIRSKDSKNELLKEENSSHTQKIKELEFALLKVPQIHVLEKEKMSLEKLVLENESKYRIEKSEFEKIKSNLTELLREKDERLRSLVETSTTESYVHDFRSPSTASKTPPLPLPLPSSESKRNLYDSLRVTENSTSMLLEGYESQLKYKEGENSQLIHVIASLEKWKESMTSEMTSLTEKTEHLENIQKDHLELQVLHAQLEEKYATMLTMYGEKVEETEELKLDLEEFKEMYKAMIEEFIQSKTSKESLS